MKHKIKKNSSIILRNTIFNSNILLERCGYIMKARAKFYECEKCHNVMELVLDGNGRKITCCNQDMKELEANTAEGALEKHIPDVTVEGDKVTVFVGNGEHPIEKNHSIMWLALETTEGIQKNTSIKNMSVLQISPEAFL